MYIAVAQNNPIVGGLAANADAMLSVVDQLADSAYPPDLVVFPAYALSGLPLDGLSYSTAFGAECLDVARKFIRAARLPCLFGTVVPQSFGWHIDMAEAEAIYCQAGMGGALGFAADSETGFDEGVSSLKVKINDARVAVFLDCLPDFGTEYQDCDLLIAMLAKEYSGTEGMLSSSGLLSDLRMVATEAQAWVVVANLVGGQDDVVFDGGSLVIGPDGSIAEAAPAFDIGIIKQNLAIPIRAKAGSQAIETRAGLAAAIAADRSPVKPLLPYEADWEALKLATSDYVQKNGFTEVVIGLSGGIDSALTATLAVDALGAENVHGLIMPSGYSSPSSIQDAYELAGNLGISTLTMPINGPTAAIEAESIQAIGESGSQTARQNLQARLRMVYLMHLSNTFDWMVINTSNKSERAMGYSTLYGDTAGAFAPFGNVYKTDIYGLAQWRNQAGAVIPSSVIDRPPSAELSAGQLDTDDLPPYEVLDRILRLHIEDRMGLDQICDIIANTPGGDPVDRELCWNILEQVKRSEYKRQQEPLSPSLGGTDITSGRAWPITNGFVDHYRGINDALDTTDLMGMLRDWERPEGWGWLDN
ncbi:MAG: NAD(+) synthase [Coriobacteriales bacterium]|nr:NAD(+) synthase [Coriobacteriales bacterium]